MKKNILIYGITGQDGSLLAKHLLKKNYKVFGFTRGINLKPNNNLEKLKIDNKVNIYFGGKITEKLIIGHIKKSKASEIYNFAGESSVSDSFKNPFQSSKSMINLNYFILESIKKTDKEIKYFNAMSGDCFGNNKSTINEESKFNPISPYAITKTHTHYMTKFYRNYYKLYTVNGIFFNHESELRTDKFVIKKIIKNVTLIYFKKIKYLEIGNIDINRDWGWAEDYVKVSYKIMQLNKADDFIIASGKSLKIIDIIRICFDYFKLDYKKYLRINKKFLRKDDILTVKVSNKKLKKHVEWKPKPIKKLIIKLCAIEKKMMRKTTLQLK